MDRSAILQKAREIKAALDQGKQIESFSSRCENFGIDEAYLVADSVHNMRMEKGEVPIGRKIGFTNQDVCSFYGVSEPIWGYVYDSTVFYLHDSTKSYHLGRSTEPKIEPEIIVHFHSAPPIDGDTTSILQCIDWVAHGFEIVQSHFPRWKFQAADTIADCGLHCMLIIGEPMKIDRLGPRALSDLGTFTISLFCNDNERDQGQGSNVLGNPINAVGHLIDVLSKQPFALPLQADEIVTTGTLTAALPVKSGQTWSTKLDGIALPGISVSFDG